MDNNKLEKKEDIIQKRVLTQNPNNNIREYLKNDNSGNKMHLLQKKLPIRTIVGIMFVGIAAVVSLFQLEIIKFDLSGGNFLFWLFSIFFAMIGIGAGFLFGNDRIRVTFLRNATRRNFGFVHFVSRGRTIFTFIKNLDHDMIKDKLGRVWVVEPERIYKHKENESYEIDDPHISMSGGIPQIFLDVDSMRPLTFYKEDIVDRDGRPIKPERAGAAIKTTIAVELAKGLLQNKTVAAIGMILLLVSGAAAYFAYDVWTYKDETLTPFIKDMTPVIAQFKQAQTQQSIITQPQP